jgi:hypothetical protein
MKCVLSTCSETVIQDIRTNNLSLINIIDAIHAVAFPVMLPKVSFVGVLERSEEEPPQAHGRLIGKLNGNEVFNFDANIDFQGKTRTRTVGEFQGLFIPGPGTLELSLQFGDHTLATVTIGVTHIGNPQAQLFGGPDALKAF